MRHGFTLPYVRTQTVTPSTFMQHDDGSIPTNDDVRELAESVLGMAGHAVLAAASGEQALALLREGARVDLLFTDVIMPGGMNGLHG
jgi:CheY-like chemotaxis protein